MHHCTFLFKNIFCPLDFVIRERCTGSLNKLFSCYVQFSSSHLSEMFFAVCNVQCSSNFCAVFYCFLLFFLHALLFLQLICSAHKENCTYIGLRSSCTHLETTGIAKAADSSSCICAPLYFFSSASLSLFQISLGVKGKELGDWDEIYDLSEQSLIRKDCQTLVGELMLYFASLSLCILSCH